MIGRTIDEERVKSLRRLVKGVGSFDLFKITLNTLHNEGYDIVPVFTLDICFYITSSMDYVEYLTQGLIPYDEIDFRDLHSEMDYTRKNNDTVENITWVETRIEEIEEVAENNIKHFNELANQCTNLLTLAFQASPEDVFYMNERMKIFWLEVTKVNNYEEK